MKKYRWVSALFILLVVTVIALVKSFKNSNSVPEVLNENVDLGI